MNSFQFSIVTAIFTVGGCVGSITGNRIAEVRGRKSAIRISTILTLLGALLMAVSLSVLHLVIGRLLVGLGSGLGLCVVPIYLSEISPASIKGSVGVLNQLGIVLGILVTQFAGLYLAIPSLWRLIPFTVAAISVIQFSFSRVAIDSPPWLLKESRLSEFKAATETLWGTETISNVERGQEDVSETEGLLSLPSSAPTSIANGPITWKQLISPPIIWPFIVVTLAMIAQQLSGVNAVLYYSNNIFSSILPDDAAYVSLGITIVNALMTFPPIYLVERLGRQYLLRLSALGSIASLFSIGYGINSGKATLASASVILFIASFAIGMGPIPYIIISDVTPFYAVSAVSSVALALNWLSNFVVGLSFLPLRDWLAGGDPSKNGHIFYVFGTLLFSLSIAWDKAYRAL